ncbi:MAG: DUF748 domain-containing protein [Deltaproteobacteria bacterium]|nr:DUF748 domain-containing protein [Deltaproteobacteria bacterium]TLN03676.1 MAG: DUF748 domain-containing protein [bacterium]
MKLPGKSTLWSIGTLAVILLFIFLLLPGILKNVITAKLEEATARKASIGRISLNPFTWSAEVSDFRLAEKKENKTFVSFSSVRIKLSPASLTKRAFIVSRLRISNPQVHIVRTAANRYNFSDLLTGKKSKKDSSLLFSLNNIEIGNGSVDFLDQATGKTTAHSIRQMKLSVPFISNIPYLADIDVAPQFSALINGARFSANGRLKPLSKSMETSAIITIRELDIPHYLAYLPVTTPITFSSGTLSTTTEVTYRVSTTAKPEVTLTGALKLEKIRMKDRRGEALLALDSGLLRVNQADVFARRFDLAALETAGLEVFLERDAQGRWTWQRLQSPATAAPPAEKKASPKPILIVSSIRSTGGKVHFLDRVPRTGFRTDLSALDLAVKDLSTQKNGKAAWNISFKTQRNESVALNGELTLTPLNFSAQLKASGLDIGGYYPYLADRLRTPLTGKLDTAAVITFNDDEGLKVNDLSLTGHELQADFGKKEGVRLTEVSLKGGKLSLKEKTAEVASITLAGGDLKASREKDGGFSYERLLIPSKTKKMAPAKSASTAAPFNYRINKVEGNGLNIRVTDRSRQGNPTFPLKGLRFSAQEISGPKSGAIPFTLASAYGKNGTIGVSGTALPSPLKLRGTVTLKRIPLRDFDAYLPDDLALSIAGGALDTRLGFSLAKTGKKLNGTFDGTLGIRSFYCLDTKENEDLLKWERLQVNGIKGVLSPFSLKISDVSLSNFYSRVTITKNRKLNLQNLRTESAEPARQPGGESPPQPTPPAPPPAPSSPPAPQVAASKPDIKINAVTLQGGTMVFSDYHLKAPFVTTFYNLGGRISGLTSEENRVAEVDLRGNLENHSPLSIAGTINPLRENLFLDLKINFSGIELSPTTPYTGTYLGYQVEKGKLYLQLAYHIENKNLTSENKLFFDQLTFGEKVDSDKATSLPVRLAVALLKDRKGEIHIDLPVTGRTDDPEFSIWRLVFQVLRNLLVKAATSPFALLQAAFSGGEDFSSVTFPPGSATLPQAEKDQLLKLAGALQDRPNLSIEVIGYADKENDPQGYRNEYLSRKMRSEKFLALVKEKKNLPGQTASSTEILPAEYSNYLKIVYRKEKFPKPRNLIGMQKDLPDSEMKKLIFANTTVGDAELRKLAEERAGVVRNFLTEEGKLNQEKVFLKSDDIYKAPGEKGKPASRVEFGALVK